MKKKLPLIISILLILCICTGIGAYLFYDRYYFTSVYETPAYKATNRTLDNPYCGWYHIYGYVPSDTEPVDMKNVQNTISKDTNELVLLEFNLRGYTASDISSAGLSQLEDVLLAWESAGRQMILRFLYDWDGRAREVEPKDISIIKRHMDQTAEIINKHTDHIYLIQGIYVGNVGEMNNSDYMSQENMYELATHLADVIDPSIYLSVRTPAHYRAISKSFEPLSAQEAFSGTIAARTGLYNDGMLGSANDLGTYGAESIALAKDYSGKGTREEELEFQDALCSYVPNGGEVVLDNEFNDLPNAVADLRKMHVSYLDCGHDLAVLNKWKESVYHGNDCFDGMDGFSYIGAHLGYRYTIVASDFTFDTFRDASATMTLSIENSGFSNSYRPFASTVTIVREDGSICDTIPVESDTRFWRSGETVTLTVPLDIRTYGIGSYRIYYKLSDPASGRRIRLSNTLGISEEYGCRIAALTINKNS